MIESENINVLHKIYDILNDEFKKKNTKLSKVKLYRAIFFDEFGKRDDSHYFHKFKHIKNFNGNDFEEITCAFQSQNGNGEMKYFNGLFQEIDKKALNEFKAVCKSRLINECCCDIVDLNNFSLDEIIMILLFYYIEQIREPIEIKEKIICEGRDKEFEQMEESISNNNFAIVCGYPKTGKTEFVEKYLQDNDYMMLYYDYSCDDYNSYDKIINNILKDNYVVEFLESIGRISELDFSKRIKLLKESNQACKKAIVIDNFRDSIGGENNEANKIVIDVGYVMDWTGAKMELVNKFLDSGWLRVYKSDEYPNRQLIYVNFPSSILSIYFSGVKINEKWVSDAICSFMDTISHKLNFEAMAFIKKEAFYSIIKTVHDFCKLQFDEMIKMRNKAKNRQKVYRIKEKVKNSFLIFHINSIRYCYKMNMVNEGIALIDTTDKYYAELNFRNHDFFINQIKEFEQKYDMLYGWYLVHFATYCSGDLETFSKSELVIYQWFLKDWIECVWKNVVFQYSNMLKGIYYQQWFDLQMIGKYIVIYREIMTYIQKSKALSAEFEEMNKQCDVLYELLCISISKFDNTDLICIKDELKIPLLYINKKLRQQYVLSIDDINPYTFCFFARAASIILIWLRKPADYITKSYFQNFLNSIIYGYYSKFIMVERYIYPAISQEIRTEMRNISESGLLIKDFYSTED